MQSSTNPYKIILADDHKIIRAGLKMFVEAQPGCVVVAEASDGEELLRKLQQFPCDLVIVDLEMPVMTGIEALTKMKEKFPAVKKLVLTSHKDGAFLKKTLSTGADGYLLKEEAQNRLSYAVSRIREGKKYVCPEMMTLVLDEYTNEESQPLLVELLTKREREVLRLTAQGLSSKEVAEKMFNSARTVESHRMNLKAKLKLTTMQQMIKFALENKIS